MKRMLTAMIVIFLMIALTACDTILGGELKRAVDAATGSETEQPAKTEEKSWEPDENTDALNPDFKAAMDSYEAFMNEYVAFMKAFAEADEKDLRMRADYAQYTGKYAAAIEDFEKWEREDLSPEEISYYREVQARVAKALLAITELGE